MQLQHTYTEAHSDDITVVAFHPSPSLPHVLLSGSVDGLVNTYDVRMTDEDDAVQSTVQFGASLASAGWMALSGQESSPDHKGIWGATTIETVQFWDVEQVRRFCCDLGWAGSRLMSGSLRTARAGRRFRRRAGCRAAAVADRVSDRRALQRGFGRRLHARRVPRVRLVRLPFSLNTERLTSGSRC